MNCEKVKDSILLYLYNELPENERDAVETHTDSCETCAGAVENERRFLRSLPERRAPEEAMLAECRHDLMRNVYRMHSDPAVSTGWWGRLQQGLASMRLAWQPTAALALLAVGFYGGRMTQNAPAGALSPSTLDVEQASLMPLGGLGDIQSVRMDPDRGEVEIVVEEITRRTISGPPQEPHIRSLLISTVREYPNSGVRLDTLDVLSARAGDREVQRALREAMLHDENPGVRLKAFEALKPHRDDPEVRQALIEVLLHDENPGMRVQAIDLLTEAPDRRMVGLLQNLINSEPNNYVRMQSRRILHELDASADHF